MIFARGTRLLLFPACTFARFWRGELIRLAPGGRARGDAASLDMALKKPLSQSRNKTTRASASSARKSPAKTAKAARKPAPKSAAKTKAQLAKSPRKAGAKPIRATRKAVPKPRLPAARKAAAKASPRAAPKSTRKGAAPKLAPERELARRVVQAALEIKAEAVLLYDLQKQSSITDYVLLCSGRSQGHVRGIADKIEEQLKARQIRPTTVEGYAEGSWIVMDYGDVIAHVFHPETRSYYDLESLLKPFPHETFAETGGAARGARAAP